MTQMPVSVIVSDSIFRGSSRTAWKIGISDRMNSYTHQIDADGGYKTATITLPIQPFEADDWITNGLGRHVETFSQFTIKCWEGFINSISISMGGLTFSRGPLTDIGNRIQVKYTDFTVGQPAITTAQNDTDSQTRYGIWHKVISAGRVSSTTADNVRNTFLQENKLPESSPTLSSQSSETLLTLTCQGYIDWLTYPYNEATDTTYTAREKVLEVLGDSPNTAVFSTDYNNIETNTLSVNRLDSDYRLAIEVIRDIVAMGGDSNNNRRLFAVYDDRLCYLYEIPNEIKFTIRQAEGIIRGNSREIYPFEIRPGNWLQVTDFIPGQDNPTNLRDDPRNIFIESVVYTAPYDYQINGGKTGTLSQQLAKLGTGGI